MFRNFCPPSGDDPAAPVRLDQRGLTAMLKSLKLFKLFAKFDLTMCWTGSAQARHGSGGVPGEEYITFKTFVSTTVPMIAAKAFGAKTTTTMTPTGTSTTAAGGMGRQKPARAAAGTAAVDAGPR